MPTAHNQGRNTSHLFPSFAAGYGILRNPRFPSFFCTCAVAPFASIYIGREDMIKRRFFRLEHGDKDDATDSSSSSDSELEAQAPEESEDDAVSETKANDEACSSSSGYESEDSSTNEAGVNSSDGLTEDDAEIRSDEEVCANSPFKDKSDEMKCNGIAEEASEPVDVPDCVLQIKSVFRCRICPRILCLTEETMKAHLNSKRHARSEKLLKENRLKAMLNSDGEVENQETAAEVHARIVALAEDKKKKKIKKRQPKQSLSTKENVNDNLPPKKPKQSTAIPAKRRRKSEK